MKEDFSLPGIPDSIEDLAAARLAICKKCPLYKMKYGVIAVCNSKLYLNKTNGDVSTTPKEGYREGCGCSIEYRVHNPTLHCVCGKW